MFRFTSCLVVLVAFGGAAASAATVTYVGEDATSNDRWRTTDHLKPLDADADNAYGTDGYFVAIEGSGDATPDYASVTIVAVLGGPWPGPSNPEINPEFQAPFDDPALTGPGDVPDIVAGDWWIEPPQSPESDYFSIELTEDARFRLGVIADQTDLYEPARSDPNWAWAANVLYESPREVRVRAFDQSGGPGDSGMINTLGPDEEWRNGDVDYFFFDISGQQGDIFIVSGLNDPRWPAIAMAGVTFDTIPEPSTLILLAMGAVALLAYTRRKRLR